MSSCIACGILKMLSLKFSDSVKFLEIRWLITITNPIVYENTIAYYFRKNFFPFIKKSSDLDIVKIIIEKQTEISE